METRYNPGAIEAKCSGFGRTRIFPVTEDPDNPKYYVLRCSLSLRRIHMGHVRNYTIGDVVARYKRMQGFNILHPMAGTPLACPRKTRRWPMAPILLPGPMKTSTTCGSSSNPWATAMTGAGSWPLRSPVLPLEQMVFMEMFQAGPGL